MVLRKLNDTKYEHCWTKPSLAFREMDVPKIVFDLIEKVPQTKCTTTKWLYVQDTYHTEV